MAIFTWNDALQYCHEIRSALMLLDAGAWQEFTWNWMIMFSASMAVMCMNMWVSRESCTSACCIYCMILDTKGSQTRTRTRQNITFIRIMYMYTRQLFSKRAVKGVRHEIFNLNSFHESFFPRILSLGPTRIFTKIRGDIQQKRLRTLALNERKNWDRNVFIYFLICC